MKYILAIVIFGVIVIIHEMGHFFTAKMCGIKVNKFSVGMGPALLKKQWGETEYSVRLFPIGGFCAMEGEDEDSVSSRAFGKKSVWQRMTVVLAGAAMNILLGFLIFIVIISMDSGIPSTIIDGFHTESEDSSVYAAQSYDSGLRAGDKIIKIDGMRVWSISDLQYGLISADGSGCEVVVKRGGEKVKLKNVVFKDKVTGGLIDFYVKGVKKNPLTVLEYSGRNTASSAKLVWTSLKDLIIGKYGVQDMSGPVGLVNAIGEAADSGETIKESVMSTLNLTTLITINLGVINLLPIPGLDGGRFLFLIIEAIRRKPIKPEHEGAVHLIGMALLMLMIVFVTFGDIKRLLS